MPRHDTPPPGGDASSSEVTALSPWRASVARARVRSKADALISLPDADHQVPELPAQQLYDAIVEVGLPDAGSLLELASPEQVRSLFDLDVWERDRVRDDRALDWMLALADLGPTRLGCAARALDPEFLALFLRRHLTIYDLTLESPPEELEPLPLTTPDRFFALHIKDEGELGQHVAQLVDFLYRFDADFARKMLQASRYELDSELEEMSYRWRSGRMEDLGFADYYDALELYRYLDPAGVQPGEGTADPPPTAADRLALSAPVAEVLSGPGFLALTLAAVREPAEVTRLQAGLVTLCNRVLAADRVDPSDAEAAEVSLERARGFLSLGLEYLGHGDPEAAAEVLRSVSLIRCFRVGVSLTLKLQRLVQTMSRELPVTLRRGGTTLLDSPFAEVAAALRRRPPMLSCHGDEPPGRGVRPIANMSDLRHVAELLAEAAEMTHAVVGALGISLPRLQRVRLAGAMPSAVEEIRLGDLVRTAVVRRLGGGRLTAAPLRVVDVERFLARSTQDGRLAPAAMPTILKTMERRLSRARQPIPSRLESWLGRWLAPLQEHVTGLALPVEPRLVAGVLMRRTVTGG